MRNLLSFLTRTPVVAALLVALGVAAEFVSGATVQIWSFLLVNVLLAQSINLLTGVAGQISLGHAGFLGIGAYGSALLMKNFGLPLPLTLLAGAAMGAVSGWLLSFAAGRVREFYLAMMTLGFGMIFYEVVREWTSVTGGMMGLSGVPSPGLRTLTLFGWSVGPTAYFQIMLAGGRRGVPFPRRWHPGRCSARSSSPAGATPGWTRWRTPTCRPARSTACRTR
ncbi:hypothetical protein GAY28_35240 [Azospirillum brasilense]|nr:hypothetical protein [Azospirillum brasilense]